MLGVIMNKRIFCTLFISTFYLILTSGAAHAATLAGKANFSGTAPAPEPVKMGADPNCAMMHPNGAMTDAVIVNSNNTLKNVFVYVKEGVTGKFEAPKTKVMFDQKGCEYKPKVFGIQVGQPLEITNSDDTLHNVHSLSKNSPEFNIGMPIKNMKLSKTFAKPEVMVKIKCEVHPWMAAYAGVVDHPFYAVTSDDGSFEIKNLPPGQYVIEAWHEKYGTQTQNVTIAAADETKELGFDYKA